MKSVKKDSLLHEFIKENIDTFDEEYLSDNRDKSSLNKYYTEKREKLIKEITEKENEFYLEIMTAIGNCKDSNLLTDEFYNNIYRNIEELNENYLEKTNTKAFLHEMREDRRKQLELEQENI
ncbi:5713_t:CDS:2 [Scutellospora calospora]|uniref:5713_t:CDS:1 n=1 Tax=Scutellospora calospora TaxID=85575 RepID=A0ACA9JUM1_9GLOM|nr:5713_t:CDS:2 [Scutellospora calospora]